MKRAFQAEFSEPLSRIIVTNYEEFRMPTITKWKFNKEIERNFKYGYIDLSEVKINKFEVKNLIDCLKTNIHIRKLKIGETDCIETFITILSILFYNSNIISYSFHDFPYWNEMVLGYFQAAMEVNKTIKYLCIKNIRGHWPYFNKLMNLLNLNESLTSIMLGGLKMENDSLQNLFRNKRIKYLNLENLVIGEKALDEIEDNMSDNILDLSLQKHCVCVNRIKRRCKKNLLKYYANFLLIMRKRPDCIFSLLPKCIVVHIIMKFIF